MELEEIRAYLVPLRGWAQKKKKKRERKGSVFAFSLCLNEYPLLLIKEGLGCLRKERHWGLQWREVCGQVCQCALICRGANAFPYSELHPSLGHSGTWCSSSGIAGRLSWDTSSRNGLFHNHSQLPSVLIYLHAVRATTATWPTWWALSAPVVICQDSVMKSRWETCTSPSASLSCQCEDAFKGSHEGALEDVSSFKSELTFWLLLEMLLEWWEGQGYS